MGVDPLQKLLVLQFLGLGLLAICTVLSTYIFLSAWRNSSRRVLPSKSLAMAQPAA